MFQNEIDEIINHLLLNGLYDRSIYKFDSIQKPLLELYPEKNNYKIRKIIKELINKEYLFQIFNGRSYLYQFNNKDNLKPTPKKELDLKTPLIITFD
tara:strand:+ start:1411 stop:1701 length:291 start_codon:yes stop_codon:yes gene_type:complete